jgi:hypothetical protein
LNNINWTQSIITAILAIVVSIGGGMILFYLQSKEPKLVYQVDEILPFKSQKENLNIYRIKIKNTGSKPAENILTEVTISPAKIKDYNITTEFPIEFKSEKDSLEFKARTNSLNPNESYDISILAITNKDFPNKPIIKLSARGIIGKEVDGVSKNSIFDNFIFTSLIPIITLLISFIVRNKGIGNRHAGEQDRVLAYIYGIHQLSNEVDRLLALPKTPAYWSEADRLTSNALTTNDINMINKVKLILVNILDYADPADSSKGIINFNLYKLEKAIGNTQSSNDYLDKAKKFIPKLIENRLKIDTI